MVFASPALREAKASGSTYYWTGKPCKNGHLCYRVTKNRTCLQCALEATSAWRDNNREVIAAYSRQYSLDKPEVKRISEAKRRARKTQAGGEFTKQNIEDLYLEQDGKCAVCQIDLAISGYHIDHKIPISRGGTSWPDNLQLLCPPDNCKKNAMTADEYLTKLGLNVKSSV